MKKFINFFLFLLFFFPLKTHASCSLWTYYGELNGYNFLVGPICSGSGAGLKFNNYRSCDGLVVIPPAPPEQGQNRGQLNGNWFDLQTCYLQYLCVVADYYDISSNTFLGYVYGTISNPVPFSAPAYSDGRFGISVSGTSFSGNISFVVNSLLSGIIPWGTVVDVYNKSSLLATAQGAIAYGPDTGINLKCNDYDFVYYNVDIDACYSLPGGVYNYIAYEYKSVVASYDYAVSLVGVSLPDIHNVEASIPLPYYAVVTDSFENTYYYGFGVGSVSFDVDFFPSGLYTVYIYDNLWNLIDIQNVPLNIISSSSQPLPSDFDVYSMDWSYLGSFGSFSVYPDRFISNIDFGASVPVYLSFCGSLTCLNIPTNAVRSPGSCPIVYQNAFYYGSHNEKVPLVPVSIVDGIYTFEDYNNHSGSIIVNALDCNSNSVSFVLNGKVPTCSVIGSGGRGGGRRGVGGRQTITEHTVGGAYERVLP